MWKKFSKIAKEFKEKEDEKRKKQFTFIPSSKRKDIEEDNKPETYLKNKAQVPQDEEDDFMAFLDDLIKDEMDSSNPKSKQVENRTNLNISQEEDLSFLDNNFEQQIPDLLSVGNIQRNEKPRQDEELNFLETTLNQSDQFPASKRTCLKENLSQEGELDFLEIESNQEHPQTVLSFQKQQEIATQSRSNQNDKIEMNFNNPNQYRKELYNLRINSELNKERDSLDKSDLESVIESDNINISSTANLISIKSNNNVENSSNNVPSTKGHVSAEDETISRITSKLEAFKSSFRPKNSLISSVGTKTNRVQISKSYNNQTENSNKNEKETNINDDMEVFDLTSKDIIVPSIRGQNDLKANDLPTSLKSINKVKQVQSFASFKESIVQKSLISPKKKTNRLLNRTPRSNIPFPKDNGIDFSGSEPKSNYLDKIKQIKTGAIHENQTSKDTTSEISETDNNENTSILLQSTGINLSGTKRPPGPAGYLVSIKERKLARQNNGMLDDNFLDDYFDKDLFFRDSSWMQFLNHHGYPEYLPSNYKDFVISREDSFSGVLSHNISKIFKGDYRNELKVPHLAVVIKRVIDTEEHSNVLVSDPTGSIQASIEGRIFKKRKGFLEIGTTLILKNVSILYISAKNQYLNITLDNMIQGFIRTKPNEISAEPITFEQLI